MLREKEIDKCGMKKLGMLLEDSSESLSLSSRDRWPQTAKQEGDKISKTFLPGM